jgi:pimeloyl-ACP methyl ester carboxylesterase
MTEGDIPTQQQRRRGRRSGFFWTQALVLVAGMAIATGCASLDSWQRKAIFQPNAATRYAWAEAPADTEAFDLVLANGDKVRAWYLSADDPHAPTVLYLHGARRNLNGSVTRLTRWRDRGFNMLAIDYRGFGESTPILPSEQSAIEDTHAAFEELKRRQNDPAKRFVYGYSLGGAMAIELAAAVDGFAGVVLEATFTSIRDMVRESKWGWVPLLQLAVTQQFDSIGRIARVNEPLLLIHGTADRVVPHAMSDALFAAAHAVMPGYKRLLKIEGASHFGIGVAADDDYDATVREFAHVAAAAAASLMASEQGNAGASGTGISVSVQ